MAIRFEQVAVNYGSKQVLEQFSCTLPEQGVVCFFGPSGCGKTTLLNLLAGLLKPSSGQIHGLEGRQVSMVFQENRLLPWLTAAENIGLVGVEPAAIAGWLALAELEAEAASLPAKLSGGMQRRLAIARALAYGGDLLLLDEPFNGLDEALARRIMQRIKDQYQNKLVVLITHDWQLAQVMAEQIHTVAGPPLRIIDPS